MVQVNMHEAKTQLSKLVERALNGEEVIIARAGKPAVRLVAEAEPSSDNRRRRPRNFLPELAGIPDSVWFDPLPDDELDLWYDGPID
jgi:prevent-host-death family protein